MRRLLWGMLLGCPAILYAGTAAELVETLIAEHWSPRTVRVNWQFRGAPPAALTEHADWILAEPKPLRMAGSLLLTLERRTAAGAVQRLGINGAARVFGTACVPVRGIPAGNPVRRCDLDIVEAEWTRLHADAADSICFDLPVIAARMLVPGRPLTLADLRPVPQIHKGQIVNVVYTDGGVTIRMSGRAMTEGATGETIPVAVDLGKVKRFKGTVAADGTVQLIR